MVEHSGTPRLKVANHVAVGAKVLMSFMPVVNGTLSNGYADAGGNSIAPVDALKMSVHSKYTLFFIRKCFIRNRG